MKYFDYLFTADNWSGPGGIFALLLQHLEYTALSVAIAALIAIPIGVAIGHAHRGHLVVIGAANAARAVPTLGLLVLIAVLMGTGLLPILIALVILAIPPILTATAAGVGGADAEAVHAARALGMTGRQVTRQVEWPLALPLVVSGLRSSTLQVVATATVAAFTSSGGLGQLVISGQLNLDYGEMLAGAVLVAALAVVLDIGLSVIGWSLARRTRPHGRVRVVAASAS